MYVYTKTVIAAARATTAAAAAMMASTSKNVAELHSLQAVTASLVSPRTGRDASTASTRPFTSTNTSAVRSPFTSPRDRQLHTSGTTRDHRKDSTPRVPGLPSVASPPTSKLVQFAIKDTSDVNAVTHRNKEAGDRRAKTAPAPSAASLVSSQPSKSDAAECEVFPQWIRERKDFQVFFPRFSDRVISDEEIMLQGVVKDPGERNIVELQCLARWIMKIPSMATFLDLNQATEIAKLARYEVFRPHEYVFRKGDKGDACYLILSGEVHVMIDGEKVAAVSKNSAFGDIALQIENATRGADVRAAYPDQSMPTVGGGGAAGSVNAVALPANGTHIGVEVLKIMAEDYQKTLARCQTRRRKHLTSWLHAEVSLFRDCVESKLHFFELVSIDVPLKKGEVLYRQGESIGAFYIVRRGRVRLEVDIHYDRTHRWPCGTHAWKQQVHSVKSRVPFHLEDSAGFFGFEMFIEGLQAREYTVVADSAVELVALNRVDCFSPYFSFTPRAIGRIRARHDKFHELAQRQIHQRQRDFRRSESAAARKGTGTSRPKAPLAVSSKFPHSGETPDLQFPCLRPATWAAPNDVVRAVQLECQ